MAGRISEPDNYVKILTDKSFSRVLFLDAFSALTLLVGRQEEHLASKN